MLFDNRGRKFLIIIWCNRRYTELISGVSLRQFKMKYGWGKKEVAKEKRNYTS